MDAAVTPQDVEHDEDWILLTDPDVSGRELERVIERAVALAVGDTIELDDLPAVVRNDYQEILMPSFARNDSLRVWASRYAQLVLTRCEGNKRRTARELGISYHTLISHLAFDESSGTDAAQPQSREGAAPGQRLQLAAKRNPLVGAAVRFSQ